MFCTLDIVGRAVVVYVELDERTDDEILVVIGLGVAVVVIAIVGADEFAACDDVIEVVIGVVVEKTVVVAVVYAIVFAYEDCVVYVDDDVVVGVYGSGVVGVTHCSLQVKEELLCVELMVTEGEQDFALRSALMFSEPERSFDGVVEITEKYAFLVDFNFCW